MSLLPSAIPVAAERDIAVAQAANAQAMLSDSAALIAKLELAIEKLRRELRGKRSERTARLLDQMELQLEELVMAATEDEVAAQAAAAKTASVRSFTRKRPVRKPWPEDVERKRVVIDPPSTCACCGGSCCARSLFRGDFGMKAVCETLASVSLKLNRLGIPFLLRL